MSGHSKWATTKRAKAINDAKRSSLFTKLAKNITVAARSGADSESNFKLRIAIDKARSFNMPKDNIDRAIKRGSGGGDSDKIETILYEAYGPEGVAILLEVLTDNKNRTVSNLKHILAKQGGRLVAEGSVKWMFIAKGQIVLEKNNLSEAEELLAIEAGAEDIIKNDEIKIMVPLDKLEQVKNNLLANNLKAISSEMIYLAKEKLNLKEPQKLIELLEALDDDDDVNNIFTNADI